MTKSEHRARLVAVQHMLETAMEAAPMNMLPQLVGQYRATLDDIATIDADTVQAGIQDDLKEKRAARRKSQRSA